MRRLLACAAAIVLTAGPAAACLVCIAIPESTIADRVLASDTVVLAREDAERPFAFAPVATLRGTPEGLPIPFLVDSATRRRLAADPGAAVLLAHDGTAWTRLAEADAEVAEMMRDILAAAAEWDAEEDHAARFAFFSDRHDHPNPTIRNLALAEISRAPYALIRGMTPRLTRTEIVRVLRDPKWAEWAPVHILFLGLSDDPTDHTFVRRGFSAAAAHDGVHLAAWATALVEIDGPPAIEQLHARLREGPVAAPEGLRSIVVALATLAEGGAPDLRPGIDAAFRSLATGRSDLAGEVARHLLWAQDFSQAGAFADLLASGTINDPATEFMITNYLHGAEEADGALPIRNPQ